VLIVRIDIQAGKTTAYKRDILHAVRSAIAESLGLADDRVMQRVIETPAENIDGPEERSDRTTLIEIATLPAQDAAHKQELYTAIVAHLGEKPGIHQHDITVLVNEPSAECFAVGGVMQCTLPGAPEPDEDDVLEPEPAAEPGPEPAGEPEPALAAEPAEAVQPDADDEPAPAPAENPEV
jgi:phenylpyruvate tautomerase PptA (4-oxalocrotonate tautomerase family)